MSSEISFGLLGLKIGKFILLNSIMLVFAPYLCDLSKTIFNILLLEEFFRKLEPIPKSLNPVIFLLIKFIKDSSISIFLLFLFSLIYSLKLSLSGYIYLVSISSFTTGYIILIKFKFNRYLLSFCFYTFFRFLKCYGSANAIIYN